LGDDVFAKLRFDSLFGRVELCWPKINMPLEVFVWQSCAIYVERNCGRIGNEYVYTVVTYVFRKREIEIQCVCFVTQRLRLPKPFPS